MAITQKELERAVAIVNAFANGKETKMSTKRNASKSTNKNTKAVEKINAIKNNLRRVTATDKGASGFGLEFEIAGMERIDDLTRKLREEIREDGYRWMKADCGEVNGEWTRIREGFFYQSFPTKKARDAEVKRLSAELVKPEAKKAEPKKATPKKSAPKKSAPKKAEPSAKELLLGLAKNMTADEKAELLRALFA